MKWSDKTIDPKGNFMPNM